MVAKEGEALKKEFGWHKFAADDRPV